MDIFYRDMRCWIIVNMNKHSPTESGSSVCTHWRLTKQLIPVISPPAALHSEHWQPGTGSRGGGGSRGAQAQQEAIGPKCENSFPSWDMIVQRENSSSNFLCASPARARFLLRWFAEANVSDQVCNVEPSVFLIFFSAAGREKWCHDHKLVLREFLTTPFVSVC